MLKNVKLLKQRCSALNLSGTSAQVSLESDEWSSTIKKENKIRVSQKQSCWLTLAELWNVMIKLSSWKMKPLHKCFVRISLCKIGRDDSFGFFTTRRSVSILYAASWKKLINLTVTKCKLKVQNHFQILNVEKLQGERFLRKYKIINKWFFHLNRGNILGAIFWIFRRFQKKWRFRRYQ